MVNTTVTANGGRLGSAYAEMDRLFDQFFGGDAAAVGGWSWPAAVWQDADQAQIELEMPGVDKQDVEITIEQGRLTVVAERKAPQGERQWVRNERRYGRFVREFQLPKTVDTEAIQADLANGVLTVKLSKKPEAQPRKVEIRAN